ncbi:hypothetical protein ETI11_07065 [Macrococcoides canis]|uniref:Membrane-associated protein n=1 Tax=Macrococcoides canis TaxID=1855823 RepID=A0A4R6C5Z1_9STAP|nr:hypothetical protein [Macrococcus canis]TDM17193.1 hypothetical protein ETI04_04635 [Macrococcus canis]TDM36344.1 hypothetical protein ETI11_07065 [Macrococcus canis]
MKKFCTNCGHEAPLSHKVCTNCGTPFPPEENEVTHNSTAPEPLPSRQKEKMQEKVKVKENKKKKPVWPFLLIGLLLAALIGAYFFLNHKYSPETHAKSIETAINDKDYQTLSSLLTVGQDGIAEEEAKAFATMIEKSGKKDDFFNELHAAAKDKNDTTIQISERDVLDLKRNGKHFSVFPKYNFEPVRHKVSIEGKEDADIEFTFNGKQHTISIADGKETEIGTFVAGKYALDAQKTIDGQSTDGTLDIDVLSEPQVQLAFDEHFINIKVEGDSKLDASETQVFVNDNEVDYNSAKTTYGPYKGDSLSIYAEGELDGKNFKTPTETLTDIDLAEGTNSVTLSFDEDDIDAYIAEQEQEKEETKTALERAEAAEARAKAAEERAEANANDDEDSDTESDSQSDIIMVETADDAIQAAGDHLGISDLSEYGEVRTPDAKSFGYGFGVFDDNGNPVMSFDVYEDGTVVEYDETGEEIDRSNPYE